MRVLVGWDTPGEADLLGTFLSVEDGHVQICTEMEEAIRAAQSATRWDAVLIATSFPDEENGYDCFKRLKELLPDTPFVGAVPNTDVVCGMRSVGLVLA